MASGGERTTSFLSKHKRIIYKRKITGFWNEFRQTKIGMVGLALLLFFVFIAAFGPLMAPYPSEIKPVVASSFSMPEWVSVFPAYSDSPRTTTVPLLEMAVQDSSFVNVSKDAMIVLNYAGKNIEDEGIVRLIEDFDYPYQAPDDFSLSASYAISNLTNMRCNTRINLIDTMGLTWNIIDETRSANMSYARWIISSKSSNLRNQLFQNLSANPARIIFGQKGTYRLCIDITFKPRAPGASATLSITGGGLTIWGKLYGILGTDGVGRDVYSQVLMGARMSIMVGLIVAAVSVSLSVIVGVVSGYLGGVADGALMRLVDVVMCLPMLVILLILKRNLNLDVLLTMLLIAFLIWGGGARTIRSRVLSVKESTYIENARAAGASSSYIMRRHVIPNIVPLAMASLILVVPHGILLEATLNFLGFGDPTLSTWGRILSDARLTGAWNQQAWWYIFPPGIAIVLLCLSFVFIGHSVDTIVNPRLRQRK